jgi:lysyl-tRNA synthetase class 1
MKVFWADKLAEQIVKREKGLNRVKIFNIESGIGASGIPHIGSVADTARAWAVSLALRDAGHKCQLIVFSDDRDGLRKVPIGFPNWLEKKIGQPVTDISDPFECHSSYGEHMSAMLLEALEMLDIKYKFQSAYKAYTSGILNSQIDIALKNSEKIKDVVKKMLGQDLKTVYFPLCENCGKLYTTRVTKLLPGYKIEYVCDGSFIGKNMNTGKNIEIKGCGYKGETSYFDAKGKLAWKVEFAARWAALKICFEAYGKDIADSVKVNDWVSEYIYNWKPPLHTVYEMFLSKAGTKISKSAGNVLTPQEWLKYGSPQSLRLLFYRRFSGTREIGAEDIPFYMDDVDRLARIWSGREKIKNERELAHSKRLFQFINNLKEKRTIQIGYNLLVSLASILPIKEKAKIIKKILTSTGHIPKKLGVSERKELEYRIALASNWASKRIEKKIFVPNKEEKNILSQLAKRLERKLNADQIQAVFFELAREYNIPPNKIFQLFYKALLGLDSGPRAGPLIEALGRNKVIAILKSNI